MKEQDFFHAVKGRPFSWDFLFWLPWKGEKGSGEAGPFTWANLFPLSSGGSNVSVVDFHFSFFSYRSALAVPTPYLDCFCLFLRRQPSFWPIFRWGSIPQRKCYRFFFILDPRKTWNQVLGGKGSPAGRVGRWTKSIPGWKPKLLYWYGQLATGVDRRIWFD